MVATYVLAPVPNWLCGKASNRDDFMDSGSSSVVELGRFLTGFMVVMGVGEYILRCAIEDRRTGEAVLRGEIMC